MAKIQFENGQTVEFDGDPTPADIEHVASQIGINGSSSMTPMAPQIDKDMSFLAQSGRSIARIPSVYAQSAGNLIGGTVNAITHPFATIQGIGQAVTHPFSTIQNFVKDRYDSPEAVMKTLANDPFGVMADASGLSSGAGALLGAVGKANNLSGVARVGEALAKPMTVSMDALNPIINKTGQVIGNIEDRLKGLPKDYAPIIAKNADEFSQLLNPGKGEIQALAKKGKELSTPMQLAAKEQLIIGKHPQTGKLDTTLAQESLSKPIGALDDTLQTYLESVPGKTFNLNDIAAQVKTAIKQDPRFSNAEALEAALKDADRKIAAEKRRFGTDIISAPQFNTLKRGMWSVGYDGLKPNSQKVARIIGSTAQQAIEQAFPDGQIGMINQRMGDYLTLQKLLENANGRIIPGGKIGKYGAQAAGAITGLSAHQLPVIGPIAGHFIGGKVADYLGDPTRITTRMAKRMKGYPGDPLNLPMSSAVKYTPTVKGKRLPIIKNQGLSTQ